MSSEGKEEKKGMAQSPPADTHAGGGATERAFKSERQRRASSIASLNSKAKATHSKSVSEFVKLTRANLEFQLYEVQAQLDFLNALADMSDEDKLALLFRILDKDKSGHLDARELANGLQKGDEDMGFGQSLESAIDAVAMFDKDRDRKLNLDEFREFLESITSAVGITFHEVSELLVIQVLFSDTGDNLFEEVAEDDAVKDDIDNAVKDKEAFNEALVDERMMTLFLLFDLDSDGRVDFKEVAIGLYRMLGDMEASTMTTVGALLMFDKDDKRSLKYTQFAQLIVNIVASSDGELTFDDIADAMTVSSCKEVEITEDELAQLMIADEIYQRMKEVEALERDAAKVMDALQYGRMQRLFDLIDLDHSGQIDFEELALSSRKFNEAKRIEDTVERAKTIMIRYDSDNDQKLDRVEFAMFFAKLAEEQEQDLHELIDFCLVLMAVKDNDEAEKSYIRSVGEDATAQIKALERKLDAGVFA